MWLQIRSGDDAGRVIEVPDVPDRPFVLGRVRGADYVLRDERASRRHLQLVPLADGRLHLRDLGSANGTHVDGRRVVEAVLLGGEEIRIGAVAIKVLSEQPAGGGEPAVATVSMVRRLVVQSDRHSRRAAYAGIGLGVLAIAVVLAIVLIEDDPVPDVVRELEPAVVGLRFGDELGTGWVLDAGERLVVTNAHVVNGGFPAQARLPGGTMSAHTVGAAPCEDLAVVKLGGTISLRAAQLGSRPRAGETVVALGYPAGSDSVASTTGVVSSPRARFADPAPDVPAYPDTTLTDTALNPGNSGGPLVDLDSRVVGINSAARTSGADGRPLQGQNYAIAIDRARPVLADLRKGTSRAWLGVTFAYPTVAELADRNLPPGIAVAGVIPGSGAERSGLRAGDHLFEVNGRALRETLSSWCDVAADLRSGDTATVGVLRPGARPREQTLRVRMS